MCVRARVCSVSRSLSLSLSLSSFFLLRISKQNLGFSSHNRLTVRCYLSSQYCQHWLKKPTTVIFIFVQHSWCYDLLFVSEEQPASLFFFSFFLNPPLYAARGSFSHLQTSNLQLSPQPLQLLHADRRLILQECSCARTEPGGKKRGFPLLSCLSLGLPAAVSASSMFLCTDLHPLHTHAHMHARITSDVRQGQLLFTVFVSWWQS